MKIASFVDVQSHPVPTHQYRYISRGTHDRPSQSYIYTLDFATKYLFLGAAFVICFHAQRDEVVVRAQGALSLKYSGTSENLCERPQFRHTAKDPAVNGQIELLMPRGHDYSRRLWPVLSRCEGCAGRHRPVVPLDPYPCNKAWHSLPSHRVLRVAVNECKPSSAQIMACGVCTCHRPASVALR